VTVSAYILIQTEVGRAASVAAAVRDIPGVQAADDVTGPYDVVVRLDAASIDDLGKVVVGRVQMLEGITKTTTMPVVHL
jgi:DNA-binding Lrp family transcriptional regulator